MFKSILIANRGEIACRIMRTAKAMDLRTIAVYSTADEHARHVGMADEAYWIGEAEAAASYLDGAKILDVARQAGAECIHPGYGFLSENAGFSQACATAGIAFVGPQAAAIEAMGLKDKAKALMEQVGVPVVPGIHGSDQSAEELSREADKIGYPILIKAVAGGGATLCLAGESLDPEVLLLLTAGDPEARTIKKVLDDVGLTPDYVGTRNPTSIRAIGALFRA